MRGCILITERKRTKMNMRKKSEAFSIVELIIAVVVIAILISIAVISYSWMRNDAADAKLEANTQTIVKQIKLAYIRNKGENFSATSYDNSYDDTASYDEQDNRSIKTKIKDVFLLGDIKDEDVAICSYAIAGNMYDFRVPSYIEDGPDNCRDESSRSKVKLYIDFCEGRSYDIPSDASLACPTVARWSYAKDVYVATVINKDGTVDTYEYDDEDSREGQY